MESIVGKAPIRVKLGRVEGTRIDTGTIPDSVSFDVDVSMDEESRTNDELTITFNLTIRTKPSLVKFEVGGTAMISGGGREAFVSWRWMKNRASPRSFTRSTSECSRHSTSP